MTHRTVSADASAREVVDILDPIGTKLLAIKVERIEHALAGMSRRSRLLVLNALLREKLRLPRGRPRCFAMVTGSGMAPPARQDGFGLPCSPEDECPVVTRSVRAAALDQPNSMRTQAPTQGYAGVSHAVGQLVGSALNIPKTQVHSGTSGVAALTTY